MRLCEHVTRVATEDGAILLDERSGQYWHLNATAALVLDVLADSATADPGGAGFVRDAADALAERYGLGVDQAERDTTALIDQLRAADLVT